MSEPTAAGPSGVCTPWAGLADLTTHDADMLDGHDAVADAGFVVASEILYRLTGRRWPGACPARTVEFDVRCWTGTRVDLPGEATVTAVTGVAVDGVPLTGGWRLVAGRGLERTTAGPLTVPTAWSGTTLTVTFEAGTAPPAGGVQACAALAAQLALAALDNDGCRLPSRVQSVTRQGLTVAVMDDLDFLDKGLTGLPDVDLWIRAVNPARSVGRVRVWSPETASPTYR